MENMDLFSSQESLPLSQESFKHLWQEMCNTETNVEKLPDVAELKKYLLNDAEMFKMEGNELDDEEMAECNLNIPSSSTAASMPYTHLNVFAKAEPSALNPECATVEPFPEDPAPPCTNKNHIPPNTDWPGVYDFQVSFHPQEKTAKNINWTYSEIKKKLYVNIAVACPVNVHVKAQPPPGTVIRAMTIFSKPEHITEVAKRCLNHSSPTDPTNNGHPAPDHLIRCDNLSSKYVEDCTTKRQSVVIDYEPPQVGMEYSTYIYRFMCLGSCVGGLNRRPLQLIFTLEKDSQCLGRKVVGLRICACPGRDKRIEEKQLEKHNAPKRSISYSSTADTMSGPSKKRQKSSSKDEESVYTVTVYRRSHYELLRKMADELELAELARLLTPEESAALRRR